MGAEPIGQLVVAMGPELAAAVVHEMGVDLTADLVGELGVGTASGIVQSAGASETGALVRAMGSEFTASLVTKMGVAQNVALVAALGPVLLAALVAGMGPAFIASLSLSMSAEIFQAIFGGGAGSAGADKGDADRPVSAAEGYTPVGSSTASSSILTGGAQGGLRTTPVTPVQRMVIPTVTLPDNRSGESRLLPHLADGTRLPMAASGSTSSSTTMRPAPLQGSVGGGAAPAEPLSHPINTASTTVSMPSIDSTQGIPPVSPAGAAAPAGPTGQGAGRSMPPTVAGSGSVTGIRAVPLTHNAERVMKEVMEELGGTQ